MEGKFFRISIAVILVVLLSACTGQAGEPSPSPDSTPLPIFFIAEKVVLQEGECTALHWEVIDALEVRLNGEIVDNVGSQEICPVESMVYELTVDRGTSMDSSIVEIHVSPKEGTTSEPLELVPSGLPAYQAESWVFTSGPPGGLGYDIRMRPDDPDIMFVTDAHAGVHKSTDGGLTWFPSNSGITANLGNDVPIFCLTIDPHDYDVIWAGTQLQGHVYRSSDNGASWVEYDEGITQDGRSIRGITIDPNDLNIVYAAGEVDSVSWAIENQLPDIYGYGGEVYKSLNGGLTWSRIWAGDNIARYVVVDPRNSNRVYVSTGIFDRTAANATPDKRGGVGILRSDDGGQTWTVLDEKNGLGGLIIPSLFMHPENPDILIAAVSDPGVGGVFVTYDGGDTWMRAGNSPTSSDAVEIAVSDPTIWYSATEGSISRSDDSGSTWQSYSLATTDRSAGMPIDLQVDPRDPMRIFDNNYGGGNFLSLDGGETWVDASKGYSGATIAGMVVLPGDGLSVLAGANTSGFITRDGGETWLGTQLPSASQFILHPDGLIASGSGGEVWHSQDNGLTWTSTTVVDLMAETMAGRMGNDVASMRAFAMAPSDPDTLYLGFHNTPCMEGIIANCLDGMPNMYRSTDGGYTWQELSGTPFDHLGVLRLAVNPGNSKEVYAATVKGLFFSSNGGDQWTKVDSFEQATRQVPILDEPGPIAELNLWVVTEVVFDPFDPQVILAATQHGGIWRSDDGGQTWKQAAAGMDPNEIVSTILPDPNTRDLYYAATIQSGVFVSLDGGKTWKTINSGLDPRKIANLALSQDGSTLYAGTGSNGVWRLTNLEKP